MRRTRFDSWPCPIARATDLIGDWWTPLVLAGVKYSLTGVGPFLHVHPQDRPPGVFGSTCTLHFAPGRQPYLLLPVIPPK